MNIKVEPLPFFVRWAILLLMWMLMALVFWPLVFRAIDIESRWHQHRVCQYYHACAGDPS